MGSQKRVQWIYSSKNKWAKDYDKDLDQDFGWSGPRKAAEVFAVHVPKDSRILDAGSGTGLVGQRLAANGYHSLVAMDLSQGMLEASRKKNICIEFHQMVMGEQLGFPSDSFDAVVSVGVLTSRWLPGRTGSNYSTGWSCGFYSAPRCLRDSRLQGKAARVGIIRNLGTCRRYRRISATTKGRTGSLPPSLGIPDQMISPEA